MRSTLTATDIADLARMMGTDRLSEIFANFEGRVAHERLTDQQAAELRARLAEQYPAHAAVFDAFDSDGSIRDQAAFDTLVETVR